MVYPIDLHTHSTASDGHLTPGGLLEKAASLGLDALALTDHDTVAGIDEAWTIARQRGVTFIPGVELSTDLSGGECHVLGYFLDYRSPSLQKDLSLFRDGRLQRGERMVELLRDLGMPLSWERIQELAHGGTVTRAHVAEALLEAGYTASRAEAFERYIGHKGPAYVQRYKLTPEDAVRLIREAHGVPVLAHPTFVEPGRDWIAELDRLTPWPFLERLLEAGLLGVEAYYGVYPAELAAGLAGMAAHYGLIATGGSDFHGHSESAALGCVPVPSQAVRDLIRLAHFCGSPWVSESAVLALSPGC
jgi:predicted metal-dependent phosphoesterase TrpH